MNPSKNTVDTSTCRWRYWRQGFLLVVLAIFTVFFHSTTVFISLMDLSIRSHGNYNNYGKREHTIPTLLSVVDDATGSYVYALENPLYERLKRTKIIFDPNEEELGIKEILEYPTLHLKLADNNSTSSIYPRDALTLSWTLGKRRDGTNVVNNDAVILLYCGYQQDLQERTVQNPHQFLEAATISMARATSRKHDDREVSSQRLDGENAWYFPSFPVIGHEACHFGLFQALPNDNTYVRWAFSDVLKIINGKSTPSAIHLALGDSIDTMVVQFKTGIQGTPVVRYGVDRDSLLFSTSGTSKTYTADDMCQAPANQQEAGKFHPPGQLHVVTLIHLEPNTTYYYQVGLKDKEMQLTWSPSLSQFVSAPEVKADSEPFSYIVYGDQGCPSVGWGEGGAWTAAMTAREVDGLSNRLPIRAVHHFGDISYARGAAHVWDDWFQMISSFTTRVPLMISIGNHEYDHSGGGGDGKDPSGVIDPGGYRPKWGNYGIAAAGSGGECGVPAANHFQMPNSTNSNGVFWYSFDFANVHTIVVSSEHDLSPGSRQYQWLEADLKSVDRTKTPWLILELHRPMYEAEIDPINSMVSVQIRHRIEKLLKQYKVDMVLGGHYHSYMRACHGLYDSKCDNGGPLHITVGTSGAQLRHGHLYPTIHWTEKFIKGVFGYGRITVANASALHLEFVRAGSNSTCDDAGTVLDETWILKG